MPSSRGSSRSRDWTHVSYISCIGRQVFTTSAAWEAFIYVNHTLPIPPTHSSFLLGIHMFVHYICIFISAFNRIIYTTFLDSTYIKILCSNATGVFKSGGGKPDSILHLHQICTIKYEYEVAQVCLTLCNPVDCSLPDSSVHVIFQARILEWVAISFSRGSSRPRVWTWVSRAAGRLFTVWATREAQKVNCGLTSPLLSSSLGHVVFETWAGGQARCYSQVHRGKWVPPVPAALPSPQSCFRLLLWQTLGSA